MRCSILKLLMEIQHLKINLQQLKINCVLQDVNSLQASKICKKANEEQVTLNVSHIFLARDSRIPTWRIISWKNSYFCRKYPHLKLHWQVRGNCMWMSLTFIDIFDNLSDKSHFSVGNNLFGQLSDNTD